MGKATLALWCIHDESVRACYSSPLFVPCEGVATLSLLVTKLADALEIPPSARRSQLDRLVLELTQRRRLLCLGNFETV